MRQLWAESKVAHCASFLAHYTVIQTKNSTRNLNTLDTENTDGKHTLPEESQIVLSRIDT